MKSYSSKTDEELFGMLCSKDQRAYSELYERYKRPLLFYTLQKVPVGVAEDIVHDLFAKLWEQTIEIKVRVSYYLFKALRNRIIDYYSKDENAQKYAQYLHAYAQENVVPKTDYKIREELFQEYINNILLKFGSQSQIIFEMRMQGYSNPEIAEHLGLSEKTVRNRYSLMLRHLKQKLPFLLIILLIN